MPTKFPEISLEDFSEYGSAAKSVATTNVVGDGVCKTINTLLISVINREIPITSPGRRLCCLDVLNVAELPGTVILKSIITLGCLVNRRTSQSPSSLKPIQNVDPSLILSVLAISNKLFLLNAVAVISSSRTYPALGNSVT